MGFDQQRLIQYVVFLCTIHFNRENNINFEGKNNTDMTQQLHRAQFPKKPIGANFL